MEYKKLDCHAAQRIELLAMTTLVYFAPNQIHLPLLFTPPIYPYYLPPEEFMLIFWYEETICLYTFIFISYKYCNRWGKYYSVGHQHYKSYV